MNYTELTQAVISYAEGDGISAFTTSDLANFVRQTERRVYTQLNIPAANRLEVGNTTAGNPYLTTPSGFLSVHDVAVITPSGEYVPLMLRERSFMREAYPRINDTGVPKYYAVQNENTLLLAKTPADVYEVQMNYNSYPTSIVVAGSSWLGDNYEQVLIWGALYEAALHMKSSKEEVLAPYKAQYDEAVAGLSRYLTDKVAKDMFR